MLGADRGEPAPRAVATGGLVERIGSRRRFVAMELLQRRRTRHYRLRELPAVVPIRHGRPGTSGSADAFVLHEVFAGGLYDPSAELDAWLASQPGGPRVVDLGANLGFFTLRTLSRYPAARVTAFEPDPENARLLEDAAQERRVRARGGRRGLRGHRGRLDRLRGGPRLRVPRRGRRGRRGPRARQRRLRPSGPRGPAQDRHRGVGVAAARGPEARRSAARGDRARVPLDRLPGAQREAGGRQLFGAARVHGRPPPVRPAGR